MMMLLLLLVQITTCRRPGTGGRNVHGQSAVHRQHAAFRHTGRSRMMMKMLLRPVKVVVVVAAAAAAVMIMMLLVVLVLLVDRPNTVRWCWRRRGRSVV